MKETVTSQIVPNEFCSGCGVCAGICPQHCLEMKWTQGNYRPERTGDCLHTCPSLCLQVCPFADHKDSLDAVTSETFSDGHGNTPHALLGWAIESFVGYSTCATHRERGASGGMVTWLLEELLKRGEINRAVCVRKSEDRSRFFEVAILDDINGVRNAASTRYYPVEYSNILRLLMKGTHEIRHAVVGVACVVHAFRRLTLINAAARKRIPYLLGLVCEQYPSSYYTEALIQWAGETISAIDTVGYRFKGKIPTWAFQFRAQRNDGVWSRPVDFTETAAHLWRAGYFIPRICNFCDDVFAEAADAAFMDAWLPEYLSDPQGTSIIVTRNPSIHKVLLDGASHGSCSLQKILPGKVVQSQEVNVNRKRKQIKMHIANALRTGHWLPRMRQEAEQHLDKYQVCHLFRLVRTMKGSSLLWPAFRHHTPHLLPLFFFMVDAYAGGVKYSLKRTYTYLQKNKKR